MGWLANLFGGTVLGKVVDVVADQIDGWAERKKIRTQARIELEHKRTTADIDWDLEQVKASRSSLKDEFWTVLLGMPIVFCFFPLTAPYIDAGFKILQDSVPLWYTSAVGVAISAAFGTRAFGKVMQGRKMEKAATRKQKVTL